MSKAPRYRIPLLFLVVLAILGGIGETPASAASDGSLPLAPGGVGLLDRVVYAVDGAESSHGADPKMWRSDPNGPQGPMQVSAAAAADAGGGDRFDERQNRGLGRAYLAHMYRRYGSWPDAVAAYNWGPGRLDDWIGGGRPFDKLPPAVARYRARVLTTSGLSLAPGEAISGSGGLRVARLGIAHLQPRRPMTDRHRSGDRPDEVDRLYAEIMRATDPGVR